MPILGIFGPPVWEPFVLYLPLVSETVTFELSDGEKYKKKKENDKRQKDEKTLIQKDKKDQ